MEFKYVDLPKEPEKPITIKEWKKKTNEILKPYKLLVVKRWKWFFLIIWFLGTLGLILVPLLTNYLPQIKFLSVINNTTK